MLNTPNSDNLYLGAGEVLFDRFDAQGNPTGFRHLGNVSSLEITNEVEDLEHRTSMFGHRAVDKSVPTDLVANVAMVLEEYDRHNLALALLGEVAALVQEADPDVEDEPINGGAALELDKWYDVGALHITVTAVKQGMTTLTAGEDYEVREDAGMIRVLSSGDGGALATTWSGAVPALSTSQVHGLSTPRILGRLRYIGAADQVSGPRQLVDVWKCALRPDGALQLISEEFGEFTLAGKAELDSSRPLGQQFYRAVEIPAAPEDAAS